jgi:hypothetical protein
VAAFSTFLRIFNDTDAPSVKVRETAARDTPALSATSFSVGGIDQRLHRAALIQPGLSSLVPRMPGESKNFGFHFATGCKMG